jgi:alpha-galactosidase
MHGLDPNKYYTIHELNRIDIRPLPYEGKSFSGAYLMNNGLDIPNNHSVTGQNQSDWSSRVLSLTTE